MKSKVYVFIVIALVLGVLTSLSSQLVDAQFAGRVDINMLTNDIINITDLNTTRLFVNGVEVTGGVGSGDITAVIAGAGLTGGATSGAATLNVSALLCGSGNYSYYNGTGFECRQDQNTGGSGGANFDQDLNTTDSVIFAGVNLTVNITLDGVTITSWNQVNVSLTLQDVVTNGGCTDCITDAMVSNTLTCSDVISSSSVINDTEVDNDLTINSSGSVAWSALNSYPGAVSDSNVITQIADSLTTALLTGDAYVSWNSYQAVFNETKNNNTILALAPGGGNNTEEMQDAVLNAGIDGTALTYNYSDAANSFQFNIVADSCDTGTEQSVFNGTGFQCVTDAGAGGGMTSWTWAGGFSDGGTGITDGETARVVPADANLTITRAGNNVTVGINATSVCTVGNGLCPDTDTTYTAGQGLTLTGTEFNHTDTSSQASSDNSGRTYIQDVTLDTFGHVTGLVTATETVTDTQNSVENITDSVMTQRDQTINYSDATDSWGVNATWASATFINNGEAAGGDLGGTYPNPTVNDDSHNHIFSNIDATTSANWATVVSDETGSGLWVFATSPTLTTPNIGVATATTLDTGQGANELYAMNQDVETTDAVTFATVNTGQGANELYDMNQNVLTSSSVIFNTVNASANFTQGTGAWMEYNGTCWNTYVSASLVQSLCP